MADESTPDEEHLVDIMLELAHFGDVTAPAINKFLQNGLQELRRDYREAERNPQKIARVLEVSGELSALAVAARHFGEALRALSPAAKDWLLDFRPSGAIYDPGNRAAPDDKRQQAALAHVFGQSLAAFKERRQNWWREVLESGEADAYFSAKAEEEFAQNKIAEFLARGPADVEGRDVLPYLISQLRQSSTSRRLERQSLRIGEGPSPYAIPSDAAKVAFVLERLARRGQRKFLNRWKARQGSVPEMQLATPERMVVKRLMRLILEAFGSSLSKVNKSNFDALLIAFEVYVYGGEISNVESTVFKAAAKDVAAIRDEVLSALGFPFDISKKKRGRPADPAKKGRKRPIKPPSE